MSNLPVSAVLHRLRKIKMQLYKAEYGSVESELDDFIKSITKSDYICECCGCDLDKEDYFINGKHCEFCNQEVCQ